MRCPKCGMPNVATATQCKQCGSALGGNGSGNANNNNAYDNSGIKGTIRDDDPDAPTQSNPSGRCPKCGYPMRPGTQKCPQCGTEIGSPQPTPAPQPVPQPVPQPSPTPGGTVNPFAVKKFCLKPVYGGEPIEFSGDAIVLNRANTDPNNGNISSTEHAKIANINGAWYIQDKSSNELTFVRAKRALRIETGDRIMIGNKVYEFSETSGINFQ